MQNELSSNPLLLNIHLEAIEEIKMWKTHSALRDAVATFLSNISLLRDYLVLPSFLLDYLTMMRLWDDRANFLFPSRDAMDPRFIELREKAVAEAASWVQEHLTDEGMLEELGKQREIHFNFLLKVDRFKGSLRAFFHQSIVLAWSAFELLGRECWERIESHFVHLPQKTKKSPRFNTLRSIRNSYDSLLGDQNPLLTVFDTKELRELDSTRHLIVHRAGIVDSLFLKSTGRNMPVDQPLEVDAVMTSRLINASIDCGKDLANRLNLWASTELSYKQTRLK